MCALTRLETKQNYSAICITYLFLIPKDQFNYLFSNPDKLEIRNSKH